VYISLLNRKRVSPQNKYICLLFPENLKKNEQIKKKPTHLINSERLVKTIIAEPIHVMNEGQASLGYSLESYIHNLYCPNFKI
jgi:hypothetical protein